MRRIARATKREKKLEALHLKDEEQMEAMRQKQALKEKKLKEGFAGLMARRLFMLELVIVAGFGLLDVVNLARGYSGFRVSSMLGGLLLGGAVAGVPVLLISANQFRRHRNGEMKLDISPFQLYSRITLVLLLALLLGWGITSLLGI